MANVLLAATNLALLLIPSWIGARRYKAGLAARLVVAFILVWTALAVTGYLLGALSLLGRPLVYLLASSAIAGVQAWLVSIAAQRMAGDKLERGPMTRSRGETVLAAVAVVGAGAAVVATLLLVTHFVPNNYDTLAYRFPRAMLYLSHGSVSHFWPGYSYDPRLTLYPLGAVFLYFLPGTYALDPRLFTFVGTVCWLAGGVAVVACARALGTSRNAALIGAALYLTAPAALVSAASTNDDMIAGVPALCAALFAWRWWHSRSALDAALAGASVGLSYCTKLHGLFYYPAIVLAAVMVLAPPASRGQALDRLKRHWRGVLLGAIAAGAIALPPLIINWIQAGKVVATFSFGNSPFSTVTAATNLTLGTFQLLFGDVPNLLFFPTSDDRRHFLAVFNGFFTEHFLWWVSDGLNYRYPGGYRFRGVADVDPGLGAWEQSVTLGLLPWSLIAAIVVAVVLRHSRPAALFVLWLALSLFLRHIAYNTHIKYAEAVGIYSAFAIALAAPALAWAWDSRDALRRPLAWTVTVATVLALGGNLLIAANSFLNNHQRNLRLVALVRFSPKIIISLIQDTVSRDLTATLSKSKKINFVYTRWELEMFVYMMKNMGAEFSLRAGPRFDPGWTNIIAHSLTDLKEYVVAHTQDAAEQRMTLLGYLEGGGPIVFGSGTLPATIDRRRVGYVLFKPILSWDQSGRMATAVTIPTVHGVSPKEQLRFRLAQRLPDGRRLLLGEAGSVEQFTAARYALAEPSGAGAVEIEFGPADGSRATAVIPITKGVLVDPAQNAHHIVNEATGPALLGALKEITASSAAK